MFSTNRLRCYAATVCICAWSVTWAHAQPFGTHADCGYSLNYPMHSHGYHHGEFIHVLVEPVFPILVAPTPGFVRLNPGMALPRFEPFAAAQGVQVENFARDAGGAKGVAPGPMIGAGPRDVGPFDELNEVRRRVTALKRSTPQSRTRADRLISSADASFAKQSYARAVALYRDAIARAPDYAEAHFRLAHAYAATRRYNLAIKSAMVALELAGTARRDGFSLEELYQGNKLAREQHDAMLADGALREPTDGGLQFLIGFTAHYSLNPLKAREHFRAAMQFPGAHQAYVRHFIPAVHIAEPDELAANDE